MCQSEARQIEWIHRKLYSFTASDNQIEHKQTCCLQTGNDRLTVNQVLLTFQNVGGRFVTSTMERCVLLLFFLIIFTLLLIIICFKLFQVMIISNLYNNSLKSRDMCLANCVSRDACLANCASRDACQANWVVQTVADDRISSTRRRMAVRYRLPTPCNVY